MEHSTAEADFANEMQATAEVVCESFGMCTSCGGDRDDSMRERSDYYPCDCQGARNG